MAPCLRKDLVATIVDEQGVSCVEVTDPLTSGGFRFYDFEYALAQQLTGQPLETVVAWALSTYGVELSTEALDQFIEKLAGLGFLVGGSSGAQPAALAPFSPSSGSQPFGELPATVVGDSAAVMDLPPLSAFDGAESQPNPDHAAAPEGLISGDATEYRLKESASGLWERGRTQEQDEHRTEHGSQDQREDPVELRGQDRDEDQGQVPSTDQVRVEPALEVAPVRQVPEAVPPHLEVLAGPLPPVSVAADLKPAVAQEPAAHAPPVVMEMDVGAPPDSPLASITQFIDAESSGPAPMGALDAAPPSTPIEAPPAMNDSGPAPSAPDVASWATDLADEVDQPRAERRQPPRPEVVVMPPIAEGPAATPPPRRRFTALFVLLLLAGATAAAAWLLRPRGGPQTPVSSTETPTVHVVSPQPTTFYRWFQTVGVVVPGRDDTLGFPTGGRLQDAMAPRTTFRAGEAIARLVGVAERELAVNRMRARVSYYEQLRDSSRAEGNENAARQAEAKLVTRKQELNAAQTALAELEIHPKVAGEIAELLVAKGTFIKAGAPVFRVRATGPRATFALAQEDLARARALGFCRIETIPGSGGGADGGAGETIARAIDCSFSTGATDDSTKLAVDLAGVNAARPGTQVRLASARYDGVFPVPRSALARLDGSDRFWVVSGGGTIAESRVAELAAVVDDLGLIARGISVGESVIVDPPAGLANGSEVKIAR